VRAEQIMQWKDLVSLMVADKRRVNSHVSTKLFKPCSQQAGTVLTIRETLGNVFKRRKAERKKTQGQIEHKPDTKEPLLDESQ